MSDFNKIDPKAVIARAHREVTEELVTKAATAYKVKLRELAAAVAVVANIRREIMNLELKIEQGNL